MSPAAIVALLALIQEAIKLEPSIQAGLEEIFTKPNPTPADWDTLRAAVALESYESFVPDSDLLKPPAVSGKNEATGSVADPIVKTGDVSGNVADQATASAGESRVGSDGFIVLNHQ